MEQELEKDSGRDMTPKLIEDLGMRYPTEKSNKKIRYGLYECRYCGNQWEVISYDIKSGSTKSCGCYRANLMSALGKLQTKHGLSYNKFYAIWNAMVQRCTDVKQKSYKNYGGRGITVCDEWLDVTNFITWVKSTYIDGMSLLRININGNYEPSNCRWGRLSYRGMGGNIGIYETIEGAVQLPHKLSTDYKREESQ